MSTDRNASRTQIVLPGLLDLEAASVKPFLKWAGGKSRLLSLILPHFPLSIREYHEPFLGGGSVFFAVRPRVELASLSDLNPELVNVWQCVKERPTELLQALEAYRGADTSEDYYRVRSAKPEADIARAAWFIYVNQTAWNGLWRVNKWGVFNVPWGARPFRGIAPAELCQVSQALSRTTIRECDFRESMERARAGDFVYLDPPYLPVSDTSKFSGYTEKRFRKADLIELASMCEDLTKRGVNWVLSNRDNPTIRELFSHARVIPLTTRRSVAAQNRRDVQPADSPEAIVVGGPTA